MKQKVLSLCFPTYNRGWCMKEQIERLMTCPKGVLDKVEIIVSDNCSMDDTQQIVENAIENGFVCQYIRNEINLGPDGNFVNCLKKATGRYVWLLGDDDTIIIDSLIKIIQILDVSNEYGLLHIYQKQDCKYKKGYLFDKKEFVKTVSYYITLISANIVNTKYIKSLGLEKYIGTWFPYVPLYFTAIINEPCNIIFKHKAFDDSKDFVHNGGYNFFEVFVQNYLAIITEYIKDDELILWLKKDIWPFVWGYTKQLLIEKNKGNFKVDNGWKILYQYYGNNLYFYYSILRYVVNKLFRILKIKFKIL